MAGVDEMGRVLMEFDQLPPPMNGKDGLIRMHWTRRQVSKSLWEGLVLLRALNDLEWDRDFPISRCQIVFTLRLTQLMDWDGAYGRFKVLGDALVHAGVLLDDNPQVVERLTCLQEKVNRVRLRGLRLEIVYTQRTSAKVSA
jgi:hypothetical protein